jgi:hypothetical protein
MAQTKRYHLAGATDLSLVASWHDGIYGAGAVPIASNVVYFTEGNDNITLGLTTLNLPLAHIAFTRGFGGTVGGAGTSATIAANTNGGTGEFGVDGAATAVEKLIYGAGGGRAYITAGTSGIDVVKCDGSGKLYLTGGTINTRTELNSGELDINDSTVLSATSVEIWGGSYRIDYKADATNPTYNLYGGSGLMLRSGGAITINGGSHIFQVEKEAGISTGAIILNNGTLDWRAGDMPAAGLSLLGGEVLFHNAVRPLDLSAATAVVLGNTVLKFGGPAGSKVKWPASSVFQLKSGQAAQTFARVAADTV